MLRSAAHVRDRPTTAPSAWSATTSMPICQCASRAVRRAHTRIPFIWNVGYAGSLASSAQLMLVRNVIQSTSFMVATAILIAQSAISPTQAPALNVTPFAKSAPASQPASPARPDISSMPLLSVCPGVSPATMVELIPSQATLSVSSVLPNASNALKPLIAHPADPVISTSTGYAKLNAQPYTLL